MRYDVFGDLRDWGRVLDQVERMRREATLDDHQPGLARLARYPFNWQLRQAGLRAIAELKRPASEVLQVAVQIMVDGRNDMETRLLAGEAVNGVLGNGRGTLDGRALSEALARVVDMLAKPQPPVLRALVLNMPAVAARCAAAITTRK